MNPVLKIEKLPHFVMDADGRALSYAHPTDAGIDLAAAISEPMEILPGTINLIPTGIKCEIPKGYTVQLMMRSGTALKKGLFLVNSIGLIDESYRKEMGLVISAVAPTVIHPGERIAQMVVVPYTTAKIEFVDSVEDTERGGFNSTGK